MDRNLSMRRGHIVAEYPTAEELDQISNWTGTLQDLITFIQQLWWYEPPILRNGRSSFDRKKVFKLEMHTWGWSGNEDIIGRLHSTMFWITCWRHSWRGGHYEFEINPDLMYSPKIPWGDPRKPKDRDY